RKRVIFCVHTGGGDSNGICLVLHPIIESRIDASPVKPAHYCCSKFIRSKMSRPSKRRRTSATSSLSSNWKRSSGEDLLSSSQYFRIASACHSALSLMRPPCGSGLPVLRSGRSIEPHALRQAAGSVCCD